MAIPEIERILRGPGRCIRRGDDASSREAETPRIFVQKSDEPKANPRFRFRQHLKNRQKRTETPKPGVPE
jgi:hypothetical protein